MDGAFQFQWARLVFAWLAEVVEFLCSRTVSLRDGVLYALFCIRCSTLIVLTSPKLSETGTELRGRARGFGTADLRLQLPTQSCFGDDGKNS